jgi:hypothetical protein
LVLFALLSGLDLLLTWQLLRDQPRAYEANPLARWLLEHGGWTALAAFKFGAVAGVGGLCVLIARHRPATARRVMVFACLALAAVVAYSCALTVWSGPEDDDPSEVPIIPRHRMYVPPRSGGLSGPRIGAIVGRSQVDLRRLLGPGPADTSDDEVQGPQKNRAQRQRDPDEQAEEITG